MFMRYNLDIKVFRSDKISLSQATTCNPDYILISPGPKGPEHTGISKSLIKLFFKKVPILGVCLGMQCINEVFGGSTERSPVPVHGKISKIEHQNRGVFQGLPSPFIAARYHSLAVKTAEESELTVTAKSKDNVVMGLSHRYLPVHGVQFHPESFLTKNGAMIIENFLKVGPLKNELS